MTVSQTEMMAMEAEGELSACLLCHRTRWAPWFEKNGFTVVRCQDCGFVFVNPRPSQAQLAAVYDAHYFERDGTGRKNTDNPIMCRLAAEKNVRLLKRVAGLKKEALVLDVGCGMGVLLEEAQKAGFKSWGVDLSSAGVAHCREKGLQAIEGRFEAVDLPHRFDAITATDVVEHVLDLEAFMQSVHSRLNPGGYFLFTVPNVNGFGVQRQGKDWRCFILPDHLNYFCRKTAILLVQNYGFKPVLVFSEPTITLGVRKRLDAWSNRLKHPAVKKLLERLQYGLGALKRDGFYPGINTLYRITGMDANNLVVLAQKQ